MGQSSSTRLIDAVFGDKTKKEFEKTPITATDERKDMIFKSLPMIRKLEGSRATTYLLGQVSNPVLVVRKTYIMSDEAQKRFFWHEVGILRKLKGCRFVPQLLHVNPAEGTFYETYCGEPAPDHPSVHTKISKRLSELLRRYGVACINPATSKPCVQFPTYSGYIHNVTIRNGHVCLIDFGSDIWQFVGIPRKVETDPVTDVQKINESFEMTIRPPNQTAQAIGSNTIKPKLKPKPKLNKTNKPPLLQLMPPESFNGGGASLPFGLKAPLVKLSSGDQSSNSARGRIIPIPKQMISKR